MAASKSTASASRNVAFTLTHSKHGAIGEVSIDFNALPTNSQEYILAYGLRKSLQDAFAAAKTQEEAQGFFSKRLDAIIAGTVGTRTATPANALDKEVRRLAEVRVKDKLRAKGIAISKVDPKVLSETVTKAITALGEALVREAQENLDRMAKMDVGLLSEDDFMADILAASLNEAEADADQLDTE